MGPRNPVPGSAGMAASADAIDEVEGLPQLFLFGLQHVLVMYAGTVAVPLILGSALQFTPKQVIALISADLFTSGLATLLQTIGLVEVWSASSSDPGLLLHLRCAHDSDR